mmetsp:Transcript_19857/g.48580  ORF Transcript_19857/g.48580 Transcript_19857/m.48580 type:complete len:574 (-) Transcript_19857:309-2030(-)
MACSAALLLAAAALRLAPSASATSLPSEPPLASVLAWVAPEVNSGGNDLVWPETNIPQVMLKAPVGITFSGGGSRSFASTLGYLQGLKSLGLLSKIRYLGGVSGGAWAVSSYSFTNKTDEEYFGPYTPPENITLKGLETIPEGSARESALASFYPSLLECAITGCNLGKRWVELVEEHFLQPNGVHGSSTMMYNAEQAAAFSARNGGLKIEDIIFPDPSKPFPIFGISLLGPRALSPFPEAQRMFTVLEATPLYSGLSPQQNITFSNVCPLHLECHNMTLPVGGFVETVGFGNTAAENKEYIPGESESFNVSLEQPFRLKDAVGLSSMAPATFVTGFTPLAGEWLPRFQYTSAGDLSLQSTEFLAGDGGAVQNVNLIGFIQRGIRNIIVFHNAEVPLNPHNNWDAKKRFPNEDDIIPQLPAYFGVIIKGEEIGEDLMRDQIFNETDFPRVIEALQDAQASGKGCMARVELKTVENRWFGINEGIRVNVTFVYLSRTKEWEAQLREEVQSKVVPKKNPDDPSSLPSGTFDNFPNFNTFTQLRLTAPQANLLFHLSSWVIRTNREFFTDIVLGSS